MAEAVVCQNLVKIFKVADLEVQALQGLDLRVNEGEMLALVGTSGSGKSTLLNILSALDVPSAGSCTVAGQDLNRLTRNERLRYRRLVVGHIWQQSGRNLIPELTLAQNVMLPQVAENVRTDLRRRRSDGLLELVGLGGLGNRRPPEISGGQQQRAGIAVALANAPRVLLADEPTGELDATTAHEVLQMLHQVNQKLGVTVIIVTHDPSVAAEADRTVAIRDGRTSAESVRRVMPIAPGSATTGGTNSVVGLSQTTHREFTLLDRAGRLQLPRTLVEKHGFAGRVEIREAEGHIEIWPAAGDDSSPPGPRASTEFKS